MEDAFPGLLRWFLLGLGAVVIGTVYWVSRRGGGRSSAGERKAPTGLSRNADDAVRPELDAASAPGRRIQQWVKRHAGERGEQPAEKPGEESSRERIVPQVVRAAPEDGAEDAETGDKLLVLHVQAKAEGKFVGPEILRVAEQTELERAAGSDGGFFQRHAPGAAAHPDDPPLFYMANMFSPGVFKWDEMESFSTSGLSMFAQLPGALPPIETFDELLKCARLFAAKLHGVVLDESRSDLTAQTIQHIKEDLQSYARGRVSPGLTRPN